MLLYWIPGVFLLLARTGILVNANVWQTASTRTSDLYFHPAEWEQDTGSRLTVTHGGVILNSTQTTTGHYKTISVAVTAFRETFTLDLELNRYLFGSTYIEKAITNSGEIYNDINHITSHCYYIGRVRDRTQSTAAVSTCKAITGYFAIGDVAYRIEPEIDGLLGRHTVFRNSHTSKAKFKCGTDQQLRWFSDVSKNPHRANRRMRRSLRWPQDADKVTKVVEVYVANDKFQYNSQRNNIETVFRRAKEIVNIASTAYSALGIYLVLVGAEVWTDSNPFPIASNNVSAALDGWYYYRKNSINPFHYNDNAVLITNTGFSGGVVGKAVIGAMCTNRYSGSIIADLGSTAAVASTMAHEMGHNFGLQHDDGCACNDTNNHCIMYSYTNSLKPSTKWSACSKSQMATSLSQGNDICLYNVPQTIFQPSPSACGNGIVETGEQCDCGNAPNSECNSACCNSTTCQILAPANCAFGRCCDISSCQIKSSGTLCRAISNDCDLAEYCNGVDSLCPDDTYKSDETECTNIELAYCYRGQCRSHRSQCELIWGPGTEESVDRCYSTLNIAGQHYGNCGLTWNTNNVTFIPCQSSDVMCGKLQCQDNNKDLFYFKNYYLLSSATIGSDSCHSVIFDFGLLTQDPGLVPNGAKCGNRKMCINQRCVALTSAPMTMTTTTTTSTSGSSTTKSPIRTNPATQPVITRPSLSSTTSDGSMNLTDYFTPDNSTESADSGGVAKLSRARLIGLIVGLLAGALVVLVIVIFVFVFIRRKRNKRNILSKKFIQGSPSGNSFNPQPDGKTTDGTYANLGFSSPENNSIGLYHPNLSPLRNAPLPPVAVISGSNTKSSGCVVYSNLQAMKNQAMSSLSIFPPMQQNTTVENDNESSADNSFASEVPVPPSEQQTTNDYKKDNLNFRLANGSGQSSHPKPPPKPRNVMLLEEKLNASPSATAKPEQSSIRKDNERPPGFLQTPSKLKPEGKLFQTEQKEAFKIGNDANQTKLSGYGDNARSDEENALSVQKLRLKFGDASLQPKPRTPNPIKSPKPAPRI